MYKDVESRRIYRRAYYAKNTERIRQYMQKYLLLHPHQKRCLTRFTLEEYRARNKKNRAKGKAFIDSLKEGQPCLDCGQTFPPCAMDFDHVRGEKLMNLSSAAARGGSRMRIIEEVVKCDLVCANCHRIRTHRRLQSKLTRHSDIE